MAFDLGAVVAKVKLDTTGFKKGVEEVQGQVRKVKGKIDKVSSSFTKAGTKMNAFATLPVAAFGTAAVKSAIQMEQLEKSFAVMLGGADKAQDLLAEIKEFAAATPFELSDIQAGSKALLAFGVEAENVLQCFYSLIRERYHRRQYEVSDFARQCLCTYPFS